MTPEVMSRLVRSSRRQSDLPTPEILSARLLGTGRNPDCEIVLDGYGTIVMPQRRAFRWRRFHARCLERLLVVFDWPMDPAVWRYRLFRAICDTKARDAEVNT